ncbi:hypothetical protein [Sulfodiicoccus acidiphilus]|nr:hypothetical protein [Sulfodiicoccus acidiphilus]
MSRTIVVALMVIVLAVTSIGVYALSSYRTIVTVTPISVSSINGENELEVKVLINYGPFGGTSPLSDAEVWVSGPSGIVAQNATNPHGIVTFQLPSGDYTVLVTVLHETIKVHLTQSEQIEIDYAYLYK